MQASRPRRVRSKRAASRSTASTPAGFASAARVASLASSSTCRPVSPTSSSRTVALHGRSALVIAITPRRPPASRAREIARRRAHRSGSACASRSSTACAHIGREPSPQRRRVRGPGIDVAGERLRERIARPVRQGRVIGLRAPVECLADAAHLARHALIADAHLAQIVVHVAAERVEHALRQSARGRLARRAAAAAPAPRCSTIRSNRPRTVSGTP